MTNIRAGGPSDREGTLKIGDRILAINGINVLNATLQEAYFIMKQCKGLTLFLVEYDSAVVGESSIESFFSFSKTNCFISNRIYLKRFNKKLERTAFDRNRKVARLSNWHQIEPNQVVNNRQESNSGRKCQISEHSRQVTDLSFLSVLSTLYAEWNLLIDLIDFLFRCGAIYVGDQILSIDDVSFEHVTLAEANQILKNCVGEFSRIEILPLSQNTTNKQTTQQNNKSK